MSIFLLFNLHLKHGVGGVPEGSAPRKQGLGLLASLVLFLFLVFLHLPFGLALPCEAAVVGSLNFSL